jgi:hypothetical protein
LAQVSRAASAPPLGRARETTLGEDRRPLQNEKEARWVPGAAEYFHYPPLAARGAVESILANLPVQRLGGYAEKADAARP